MRASGARDQGGCVTIARAGDVFDRADPGASGVHRGWPHFIEVLSRWKGTSVTEVEHPLSHRSYRRSYGGWEKGFHVGAAAFRVDGRGMSRARALSLKR